MSPIRVSESHPTLLMKTCFSLLEHKRPVDKDNPSPRHRHTQHNNLVQSATSSLTFLRLRRLSATSCTRSLTVMRGFMSQILPGLCKVMSKRSGASSVMSSSYTIADTLYVIVPLLRRSWTRVSSSALSTILTTSSRHDGSLATRVVSRYIVDVFGLSVWFGDASEEQNEWGCSLGPDGGFLILFGPMFGQPEWHWIRVERHSLTRESESCREIYDELECIITCCLRYLTFAVPFRHHLQ